MKLTLDNLIDLDNNIYHAGQEVEVPPLYQFLTDNRDLLNSNPVEYIVTEYHNVFKSYLSNFMESFTFNPQGFYNLLLDNRRLLNLREAGTLFAKDVQCFIYMIDYKLTYLNYDSSLSSLKTLLKENKYPTIKVEELIAHRELTVNDIEKVLVSTPVIMDIDDRVYYKSVIQLIDETHELYSIRDFILVSVDEYYSTTTTDIVIKLLFGKSNAHAATVDAFVLAKIDAYNCIKGSSTAEDATITYEDKRDIIDKLVPRTDGTTDGTTNSGTGSSGNSGSGNTGNGGTGIGPGGISNEINPPATPGIYPNLESTRDVANEVHNGINDAGQNLTVEDKTGAKDLILVNLENEKSSNAGTLIDNIFISVEDLKESSRDLKDNVGKLTDNTTKISDLTDKLETVTQIATDNKDLIGSEPQIIELQRDLDNAINDNNVILDNINKGTTNTGSLINRQESITKQIDSSLISDKYSGQIGDSVNNTYITIISVAAIVDTVNPGLLNNKSTLDKLLIAIGLLLALMSFLQYPNDFIRSLFNLLMAPIEALLLLLNLLICAIKAILCMLMAIARAIGEAISILTNMNTYKDLYASLKKSFLDLLNDVKESSIGKFLTKMYDKVISLWNEDAEAKGAEVAAVLGEEKGNEYVVAMKEAINELPINGDQGIISMITESLDAVIASLLESIDNTVKNALGMFDMTTCDKLKLPFMGFGSFRLPDMNFNLKLNIPYLDSKVIKCH